MKFAVKFLLIVFVVFLSTPTIVSVIKKTTNTSFFYSMSEEELKHKEIKSDFHFEEALTISFPSSITSGLILSENLSRHDNVASAIFIPPPEQV
jgi:ABC-type uncharacterized transport system permease subunit